LEAEIRRITVQSQPWQTVHKTISKITRAKWTGSVGHVVEHLLCKHKAPGSNPRPTKKKIIHRTKIDTLVRTYYLIIHIDGIPCDT
jgi:hypothetical protein